MQTPEAEASAEALFRRAVQLLEENNAEAPERDDKLLELFYRRLASFLDRKPTPEARREAMGFYEKEATLVERRCGETPDPITAHVLAATYQRIGELAREMQTAEGRGEAKRCYQKAMALLETAPEQLERDVRCRRLAVALCRELVALLEQEDTPESRQELTDWQQKLSLYRFTEE